MRLCIQTKKLNHGYNPPTNELFSRLIFKLDMHPSTNNIVSLREKIYLQIEGETSSFYLY